MLKAKQILLLPLVMNVACAVTGPRADHEGRQIPPKTNTIIAYSELSEAKLFIKVKKTLIRQGFSIKTQDKDTFSLQTDKRYVKKHGSFTFLIKAHIEKTTEGSKATISGDMFLNMDITLGGGVTHTGSSSPIELIGMNGSPGRIAWVKMYRSAKSISNNLNFEIRN